MNNPKCINRVPAEFVCVDSQCELGNPFICTICNDRICQTSHLKCKKERWVKINQNMIQKANSNKKQIIECMQQFEKQTNKIIKQIQKGLQQLKLEMSKDLTKGQYKQFEESIILEREINLNGRMISKLLNHKQNQIYKVSVIKFHSKIAQITKISSQLKKLIRSLNQCYTHQQNQNIIKDTYLKNLINKINKTQQQHITLKWKTSIMDYNQALKQLANSLNNKNFPLLKTLQIYYPWNLGDSQNRILAENKISTQLLKLSNFESLIIIAHRIKSKDGFKKLQQKRKVIIIQQKNWIEKEPW